ncbi:MAG: YaiI/YqxD family protein [Gammaproteobacteria bacterium]|nr:YaiI/YqxD family protein [Gammaproteobacteria bacterium]
MKIIVDADACPQAAKKIVIKAALRTNHHLVFVANQFISVPNEPLIKTVRVRQGADEADHYIADHVEEGDLVITADIPLADRVIDKHGVALNPRGEFYTKENIKQRLSMRDFLHDLRGSGVNTGGAKPQSQQDVKLFADALDRYLSRKL